MKSPSKTHKTAIWKWNPAILRAVAGLALTSLVAVGGYFAWMNSSRGTADPVNQDDDDEFVAILDEPKASEPRKLTASFGEVVSAAHQTESDEPSTVQQVGFGTSSRPESNPVAWLDGTIEIEPVGTPSHALQPTTEDPRTRAFNRYTRK